MSKIWSWVKRNTKYVILILGFIVFFIFFFLFRSKIKKIDSLESKLYEMQARLQIERIAAKNDITVEEIKDLKEKDAAVAREIKAVEDSLKKRLPKDMTAEEIAQKFREVGLL